MHKTQNSQTYFFHKFILLKDFFEEKKKKSPFFGPSGSFFARGICKKSSPFLKCFLTRQFYEFSFLRCSFSSWHAHFLGILLFFTYFFCMYKLYCAVRYTVLLYEDMIFTSLRRLLFYAIYHDKAHNNHHTMAYNGLIQWHDRPYIPSKQGGW